jgi:hypothetical protein
LATWVTPVRNAVPVGLLPLSVDPHHDGIEFKR